MNHQIFGIVSLISAWGILYFSWRCYKRQAFKTALALLMLSGFVLRLCSASDLFLHEWDERFHALVAKNLMQHLLKPTLYEHAVIPYDYRDWWSNHVWLHKQPLPLWSMAASMYLFGVNEIAVRLPSILLSTAGIGVSFLICDHLFNRKAAWFTAFLHAINGLLIELSGGRIATDHIDVYFLFFIELAILFSVLFAKRPHFPYTIFAGMSVGAAILCKWLPALIVIPVWYLILMDSKRFTHPYMLKQLAVLLLVTCIVFLPWQFYIYWQFPLEAHWESQFNVKHITEVLDEQGGSILYYFDKIGINYGELIYVALAWFLWKLILRPKDYKRLALFIWFAIPLIFFSFAKTKMLGYIAFTAPALFMITADFRDALINNKPSIKTKWLANIILLLLFILPLRYCFERLKPFDNYDMHPQWVKELKKLNEIFPADDKYVLFNYPKPIDAMFYSNFTVYSTLPGKYELTELIRKGHKVFINDDGELSEDIKNIATVNYLHLIAYKANSQSHAANYHQQQFPK